MNDTRSQAGNAAQARKHATARRLRAPESRAAPSELMAGFHIGESTTGFADTDRALAHPRQ